MWYENIYDDKTSIGDCCEERNDERDDSVDLLHNDSVDTETADRKVVSSCVLGHASETSMDMCEVERAPDVEITDEHSLEVKVEADSNDITEHPRDDKLRPYLCVLCGKWFTTKQHLNNHKMSHAGEESGGEESYPCNQYEKQFTTQHYVKSHGSKHKCTECGKCFPSNHVLTVHRRIHSGDKPFECPVCNKRFTISGNLVMHSRIHSGERPYKCLLCDRAFSRSDHLNNHMRVVHAGEKPSTHNLRIHCPYCSKLFKRRGALTRHIYIHTGAQPYSCRHCSDRFRRLDQLKTHLLKSHNDGTWFTCNVCQKKFSRSRSLKVHMLRHEGVKPYVCCECPKHFYTAAELKSHHHVHLDYKQFCCFLCGKNFKHKSGFVRHLQDCSVLTS